MKDYTIYTLIIIISSIVAVIIIELLFVRFAGSAVPVPAVPREAQTSGTGERLKFLVMGDSTAISQGSNYSDGYAVASAEHLAQSFEVTMLNLGISGATTEDVRADQLTDAVAFTPDVVLLAVGANDAIRFSSHTSINNSLQQIIDALRRSNPDVQIIVTRSPAMDAVDRFPLLTKQLMRLRTLQVNAAFEESINKNNLILAPIAEKTRAAFLADSTLTAADKFHPNARGYALWNPVIITAIDTAVGRMQNN